MDLTIRSDTFGADDKSWLGSAHGTDATIPVTLDTSAFTAGTHYPSGYFKSGIPLGKITASGKYAPYNDANTDGTQTVAGFLYAPVKAPTDNTIDPAGAMLVHGMIRESRLPIALDANGRTDVAGRFVLI